MRSGFLKGRLLEPPREFHSPGPKRTLAEKNKSEDDIGQMAFNTPDTFKIEQKSDLALQKQACTLSPIWLIPPEILRPILAAVKPNITLPRDKALLLRLMLVCRLWAAIIRDMPEMWTNIEVTDGLNGQRWLARHLSKWDAVPLSIIFRQPALCEELLEYLLKLPQNLRRVQFYPAPVVNFPQLARILSALKGASHLRELEIKDPRQYILDVWTELDEVCTFLPALETLKLRNLDRLPCFLKAPRLTYLECESVWLTADQFYGWTEEMPKLRNIRVHQLYLTAQVGELRKDSGRLKTSPPMFPSLEKLVVGASNWVDNRGHPFYLYIMSGSTNLTTVQLSTSAAEHFEKSVKTLRNWRLPQIKTVSILVDTVSAQWGRRDLNIYLELFSGVENLEIHQRKGTSEKAMIKVLNAVSNPTNKHFTALPPRIETLSFNFNGVLNGRLLDELHSLALVMKENGLNPPCQSRFSLQARNGLLIRDATVVQFADFLRTYDCKGKGNSLG